MTDNHHLGISMFFMRTNGWCCLAIKSSSSCKDQKLLHWRFLLHARTWTRRMTLVRPLSVAPVWIVDHLPRSSLLPQQQPSSSRSFWINYLENATALRSISSIFLRRVRCHAAARTTSESCKKTSARRKHPSYLKIMVGRVERRCFENIPQKGHTSRCTLYLQTHPR